MTESSIASRADGRFGADSLRVSLSVVQRVSAGLVAATAFAGVYGVSQISSSRAAVPTTTETVAPADAFVIYPARQRPGTTYQLIDKLPNGQSSTVDVDARAGLARRVTKLADVLGDDTPGAVEMVAVLDSVYVLADPYPGQPTAEAGQWVKLSATTWKQHPLAQRLHVDEMLNLVRIGGGLSALGEVVANGNKPVKVAKPAVEDGMYRWTTTFDSFVRDRITAEANRLGVSDVLADIGPDTTVIVTQWTDPNGIILRETIERRTGASSSVERFEATGVGRPLYVKIPPANQVVAPTP